MLMVVYRWTSREHERNDQVHGLCNVCIHVRTSRRLLTVCASAADTSSGNAHDVEVLEAAFATTNDYFTGSRRALSDGGRGDDDNDDDTAAKPTLAGENKKDDDTRSGAGNNNVDNEELPVAEPVVNTDNNNNSGSSRRHQSFYALLDEVAEMREEMVALKARVADLEAGEQQLSPSS